MQKIKIVPEWPHSFRSEEIQNLYQFRIKVLPPVPNSLELEKQKIPFKRNVRLIHPLSVGQGAPDTNV